MLPHQPAFLRCTWVWPAPHLGLHWGPEPMPRTDSLRAELGVAGVALATNSISRKGLG